MSTLKRVFAISRRSVWRGWSIATMISLLVFSVALAAAGDLDTTFSGDGKQHTDFGGSMKDQAYATAIQTDGKIVVVGTHETGGSTSANFAVARYKAGGALDTTFSGDGKLTTNFGTGFYDRAQAVAIQSDGKIVVAGHANCPATTTSSGCRIALARYNPDGSLDTTFSGDGKLTATMGGLSTANWGGLAIQPDGKIVVPGFFTDATGNSNFVVMRFESNGSLDTSFSSDGKVSFGFGSTRDDYASDLALQSDGKIVVTGETGSSTATNCYMAIARLTSTGTLDTTFSGDGKQTVNVGGILCTVNNGGVAIDGNGKIVVGGAKWKDSTESEFAIARLTSSGVLDTTFSGDGKETTNVPGDFEIGDEVRIVGTKILLMGRSNPTGDQDFTLLRYKSGGSLDTTFSGDGIALFDFAGGDDMPRGMAVDNNGRYVLVGQVTISGQFDVGLARVLP